MLEDTVKVCCCESYPPRITSVSTGALLKIKARQFVTEAPRKALSDVLMAVGNICLSGFPRMFFARHKRG
jgi:hypothetical protein